MWSADMVSKTDPGFFQISIILMMLLKVQSAMQVFVAETLIHTQLHACMHACAHTKAFGGVLVLKEQPGSGLVYAIENQG